MSDKILIINDESAVLDLLKIVLSDKGYDTLGVLSGKEGLEAVSKWKPDLILLDIMMPELDGYQVCTELKKIPEIASIPVIFLSSLSDPKDKIKGLEVGGVDFINRVTDKGELLARVNTHLTLSHLTRALKESNEELLQKQKSLNEDLAAAAVIQNTLLPSPQIDISPVRASWQCLPCELVGGDIFNMIRPDQDHLVVYIYDVTGHGVPSAMITVSVSQQISQYAIHAKTSSTPHIFSPAEVLNALDVEFPLERFNRFFSMFYMVLNLKTGAMKYSCAGHPPPVLLREGEAYKLLNANGTVVGVHEGGVFEEVDILLRVGDKLILYTDGITEFQNREGNFYGAEPFYKLLESYKSLPIDQMKEEIFGDLKKFGGDIKPLDDVSVLILELASLEVKT